MPSLPANYAPPYGQGNYGLPRVYGVPLWTPYTVEPIGSGVTFTAQSIDYETILVQWTRPFAPDGITITDYRLVRNRYGFPVDQEDGDILLDSSTYFGNQYQDQQVVPGSYHYYGFYIGLSTGVWVRAGFTSCLSIYSYSSGTDMFNNLPIYFQSTEDQELTTNYLGDQYLQQYLNVIGWGFDYIKTQYDYQFISLNDPMQMSLRDLYNLAEELGIPFQSEIPASAMRKAAQNWAVVSQQRGTVLGIGNAITLLTGYGTDIQLGANRMLENDQSMPQNPGYLRWNANQAYIPGELVLYQSTYLYKSLANSLNQPPTGTTSANTWWQVVQDQADPSGALNNPVSIGVPTINAGNNTGTANTLEAIYANQAVTYIPPTGGTLVAGIGEPVVGNVTQWQGRTFRVTNKASTAQDIWLRSLSRNNGADVSHPNWIPDPEQVILNGVPIPQMTPRNEWNPATRYKTRALVTHDNIPFQAQRASTGAMPPIVGEALNINPFFNGGITGWTFSGFGSPTVAPVSSATNGISFVGNNAVTLPISSGTVNPSALFASVDVIPNATYTVQIWVNAASAYNGELSIVWIGPGGKTSTTVSAPNGVGSSSNTFIPVTYIVQAPDFATQATAKLILLNTFGSSTSVIIANGTFACYATPEWIPMSKDHRLRYALSTYASQSLLVGADETSPVTPFAEFYDQGGNLINRTVCRTGGTPGTAAPPTNLSYDSFTTQTGSPLTGRILDSDNTIWSSQAGQFLIGGFNGGCTYPTTPNITSMAVADTGSATGFVSATFTTPVTTPMEQAIIFRFTSAGNYFHAGPTQLYINQAGVFTSLGTYSSAVQPGDRLYVKLSGSTITIIRNTTQVLQVTNSTFATATKHGIAIEQP